MALRIFCSDFSLIRGSSRSFPSRASCLDLVEDETLKALQISATVFGPKTLDLEELQHRGMKFLQQLGVKLQLALAKNLVDVGRPCPCRCRVWRAVACRCPSVQKSVAASPRWPPPRFDRSECGTGPAGDFQQVGSFVQDGGETSIIQGRHPRHDCTEAGRRRRQNKTQPSGLGGMT